MICIYDLRDGLLFEKVTVEKFMEEYYEDYVSGRLMKEGLCVQVECKPIKPNGLTHKLTRK